MSMNSPPRMVLLNCKYDLTKVCRSCMKESEEMLSLFSSVIVNDHNLTFSDMLMSCTDLQISLGDGLPMSICHICISELTKAYVFKQKCEESDISFRKYVFNDCDITNVEYLEPKTEVKQINVQSEIKHENLFEEEINDKDDIDYNLDDQDGDSEISEHVNVRTYEENFRNGKEPWYKYKHVMPQWAKKCPHCPQVFRKSVNLNQHLKWHAGLRPFACTQCPKTYERQAGLRVHQQQKHSKEAKVYKCRFFQCSMKFASWDELKAHNEFHLRIGNKYTCKICQKIFKSRSGITNHQLIHKGLKNYTCDICNKKFRTYSNMTVHRKRHLNDFNHLCSHCGKKFLTPNELKQHSITHTDAKLFQCYICEKKLRTRSSLQRHITLHKNEKPFKCQKCSKSFAFKTNLSLHEKRHSSKYSYVCTVCGKGYHIRRELIAHFRIHSGERPFKCTQCPKAFIRNQNLVEHMRIHTGERPYECEVCNMRFARYMIYKKHLRRHVAKNDTTDFISTEARVEEISLLILN